MKYRNTRTGAVIFTHCKVTGGSWVPFEDTDKNEAREKASEQEGSTEKTAPAETTAPPAKNPKRSSAKKGS